MSRARHQHSKSKHHAHHADGGGAHSEIGNPSVLKLAKGHSIGVIGGKDGKSHLGHAKGGKIKAHKRASGGACATHGNYSSAKLSKGGTIAEHLAGHHELGAHAEAPRDGVEHKRGGDAEHKRGGKAEHHHEGHHHRGRK